MNIYTTVLIVILHISSRNPPKVFRKLLSTRIGFHIVIRFEHKFYNFHRRFKISVMSTKHFCIITIVTQIGAHVDFSGYSFPSYNVFLESFIVISTLLPMCNFKILHYIIGHK